MFKIKVIPKEEIYWKIHKKGLSELRVGDIIELEDDRGYQYVVIDKEDYEDHEIVKLDEVSGNKRVSNPFFKIPKGGRYKILRSNLEEYAIK